MSDLLNFSTDSRTRTRVFAFSSSSQSLRFVVRTRLSTILHKMAFYFNYFEFK